MATLQRSTVHPLPCLVAIALLASGAAVAQPPGGREGGREGGRGMFRMPLMMALDADGDGEISAKEIDDAPARLRTLDANKDGKLTMDELRPSGGPGGFGGGQGGGGAGGEEMVNRLMEYDTDKDGKLKAEDLPERMRNIVTRADTNKDGVVTREELMATSRPEGGSRREGRGQREEPEHEHDHEHEDDAHEHEERGSAGRAGRRPPVEE